ncbi:MAG TPA: hypothetical protein VHP37_13330 [Burkholderiales bacterium]|nr:hypothetical protein [Burkholderiales bacterium]
MTDAQKLWSRSAPTRARPVRNAGGFYRSAETQDRRFGGIPLTTANDAVVAAIRLAYKVAEAQVDRSTRFATGLRTAGDRAIGPRSDRKAVDAVEKLLTNALMSGLAWWEGSVAEGRCPVRRLAAAEYQMLGQILGLGGRRGKPDAKDTAGGGREDREEPAPVFAARAGAGTRLPPLRIVHTGDPKERRPVRVREWELSLDGPLQTRLYFFSAEHLDTDALEAELIVEGRRAAASLNLDTPRRAPPGAWRAAICDDGGVQLGYVEILL